MISSKKNFFAIILIIILIGLGYSFISKWGKVDDWAYSYSSVLDAVQELSESPALLAAVIFLALFVISWVVISILLIIKGESENGKMNPKRIIGICLLSGPFAIALLAFSIKSIISYSIISFLIIPTSIFAFLIWVIVYAIRNKVRIALIPVIAFFLIILLLLGGTALIGIGGTGFSKSMMAGGPMYEMASLSRENIGFAVGGAKDINSFRKNIENNYLPLETDITYEGLFYDYFFDTGEQKPCQKLFCPSYTYAISKDPFSKEDEYYLSVGLNSNIKESEFKRKKLNLVIVLDISGSMSSPFNRYYYDQFGNQQLREDAENDTDYQKSKMRVASESVVALLNHLNPDDRFGMVMFDDRAYLGKPISRIEDTDMEAIKGHILELEPRGSTYFEAGMKEGTKLFDDYLSVDQSEYENRIIFLTDAMPNVGEIGEDQLLGLTKKNAENKIYTTFIGIGVDFNTELIEYITKIRGANYYSVHSAKQFKTRMDDEFEYMVTPLVFNLLLNLDAKGYNIEKVYGSPEANEATGEIMKVNTLFPSKKEEGKTKGGLVILKLKKLTDDARMKLKVSYENRLGEKDSSEETVELKNNNAEFFENKGIRKGILLSRYADLMKSWIKDERKSYSEKQPVTKPLVTYETGIIVPEESIEPQLGRWERQSIPLQVSEHYKDLFLEFKSYFENERNVIGDDTLNKEIAVLNKLSSYNPQTG